MRAIRRSGLPAPERHTLLTLTSLVEPETGLIPERFQPSLTELARFTGLGRSTIVRALNAVEEKGWVKRTVPTKQASQKRKERTSYLLTIPAAVAAEDANEVDGASARAGLVPERDQLEGWSQSGTSATAGLGLGRVSKVAVRATPR
ncbi:helix-turn-helix domain-containing protein [Actinoplanes sp. NPDC051494]|uniref:helix-turn-helix domain-containing protein n=1 Tax=Actinoplanes sp. NPDC051494 TaxID=3363907 RepID=UPI003794E789